MRVLLLAWEAARPGHLSPAVLSLARELGHAGHAVHVVAAGTGPALATVHHGGIPVTWVAEAPPVLPPTPDYDLPRVLAWNSRGFAAADRVARAFAPDVVLARGWETAYAAANLRAVHGLPIVAHLPSLEIERQGGTLPDDTSKYVHQIEWWLTYEARRVVTTTRRGRRALTRGFRLPAAKVDLIEPAVTVPARPVRHQPGVGIVAPRSGPLAGPAVALAARLGGDGIAVALAGPARPRQRAVVAADPQMAADRAVVVVLTPDGAEIAVRAMASGRLLVVEDGGPLHGLVHARRSGWRVDVSDVPSTADVTRGLAGDDQRRARIGAAARERARRRHAWSVVAPAYVASLGQAIADEAALVAATAPSSGVRPLLLRSRLLDLDVRE